MPASTATVETSAGQIAPHLIDAFARATHCRTPYDHWLLSDVLPPATAGAIVDLPHAPPASMQFDGRRESNNAMRVYFTPENQARFPVCGATAAAFRSDAVRGEIARMTGADLDGAKLRIEYCQDTDGFWLEPHTDIRVKKFTMLVYLTDDPNLRACGTDIYGGPPEFTHFGSAPCEMNKELIFIPGPDTWHGVAKRPIRGIRRLIIVNYVSPDWRDTWELAE